MDRKCSIHKLNSGAGTIIYRDSQRSIWWTERVISEKELFYDAFNAALLLDVPYWIFFIDFEAFQKKFPKARIVRYKSEPFSKKFL